MASDLVNSLYQLEGESVFKRGAVQAAWGEWLTKLAEWTWFVTLTARPPDGKGAYTKRGDGYMRTSFLRGMKWLSSIASVVEYYYVLEDHESGAVHLHALVVSDRTDATEVLLDWFQTNVGWAKVDPFIEGGGAAEYVVKAAEYASKGRGLRWEMSDGLARQAKGRSVSGSLPGSRSGDLSGTEAGRLTRSGISRRGGRRDVRSGYRISGKSGKSSKSGARRVKNGPSYKGTGAGPNEVLAEPGIFGFSKARKEPEA